MKRDLYEGGIRVPLIARWPGKIESATTSHHPSAFWDFLPTACEAAGIDAPEGIDGISYLPALTGGKQPAHDYFYWEFHEGRSTCQAVRMRNWKAVRQNPSQPLELYNLEEDIGEQNDMASGHEELAGRMAELMLEARGHSDIWPLKG
jgi:arylsulfatase A-like enzyme